MFSNSKIIIWIIVISILTKIIVIMIFFNNLTALPYIKVRKEEYIIGTRQSK